MHRPPAQIVYQRVGTAAAYNYAIVGFNNVETKNLTAPNT
jgi:hypothetical protein